MGAKGRARKQRSWTRNSTNCIQTLRFLAGLLIGMYTERNDIIGASKLKINEADEHVDMISMNVLLVEVRRQSGTTRGKK